jgi:hypothetical protein
LRSSGVNLPDCLRVNGGANQLVISSSISGQIPRKNGHIEGEIHGFPSAPTIRQDLSLRGYKVCQLPAGYRVGVICGSSELPRILTVFPPDSIAKPIECDAVRRNNLAGDRRVSLGRPAHGEPGEHWWIFLDGKHVVHRDVVVIPRVAGGRLPSKNRAGKCAGLCFRRQLGHVGPYVQIPAHRQKRNDHQSHACAGHRHPEPPRVSLRRLVHEGSVEKFEERGQGKEKWPKRNKKPPSTNEN